MNDEPDKREGKNPKQERLKLALRENLKRRKSQARGRSETTARRDDDRLPDDENGKKRNA
jgi:hypothetical protein